MRLTGLASAAAAAALAAIAAGPAEASKYSESLAENVEREVVYVDRRARPKVSTSEAGDIRLRIVKKDPGRIKVAVVPQADAEDEGGASGLAAAMARDMNLRGALLVVAGDSIHVLTTHPAADQTAAAVREAFERNEGDRAKQILRSVDGIAAVDPGPAADSGGTPGGGFGAIDDETDGIFDAVDDAIRTTTIIIAAFFIIPLLALFIWIALRVRSHRKERAGDLDFAQEGLRNQLIELGDDIRAIEVDASMPGANALALADYEAAVQQYDRANFALQRSEQNPRYVGEAKSALAEGKRRISDAKVRLGVTPIP